jgi:hypothetical protein
VKKNLLLYHGLPLFALVFPFIRVALAGNDRALKGEPGWLNRAQAGIGLAAID